MYIIIYNYNDVNFSSFPYTEPSLSKSLMLDVRLLDVYVFVKIKYFS